jgi:LysM repeat protein
VVAGRKRVFYRTLPGDTVPDVAAFFHVKTTELIRYNALDAEAKLAGNMVLQLWVPKDFDESKAALLDPAIVRLVTTGSDEFYDVVEAQKGRVRLSYSVKPGDDLKKIGRKFGLTAADLERINRFHPSGPLKVGQPLVVYRAMTAAEKAKQSCLPAGGADRTAAPPPEDDPALSDDSDALERALGRDDAGRALPRPPPPELDDHKAPAPRP